MPVGTGFGDVPANDPDLPAIRLSAGEGIIPTLEGGWFPEKLINRYQWSVVLARVIDRLSIQHQQAGPEPRTPEDVPDGHWAFGAVLKVLRLGIGGTGRRFDGNKVLDGERAAADVRLLSGLARRARVDTELRTVGGATQLRRRDVARLVAALLKSPASGPSTGAPSPAGSPTR